MIIVHINGRNAIRIVEVTDLLNRATFQIQILIARGRIDRVQLMITLRIFGRTLGKQHVDTLAFDEHLQWMFVFGKFENGPGRIEQAEKAETRTRTSRPKALNRTFDDSIMELVFEYLPRANYHPLDPSIFVYHYVQQYGKH
jgi:hypothetical protein